LRELSAIVAKEFGGVVGSPVEMKFPRGFDCYARID